MATFVLHGAARIAFKQQWVTIYNFNDAFIGMVVTCSLLPAS